MSRRGVGLEPLLRGAVSGIAGGIGLISESISTRKRSKSRDNREEGGRDATTQHEERLDDKEPLEEGDEEQWELDDAQDEILHDASKDSPVHNEKQVLDRFIQQYPPPDYPPPVYTEKGSAPQLPLPVIIPQRRPKDRTRGFIRAYAPSLEAFGIDQAMFLDFLETFHKSSQANPWIAAINLACISAMFIPHPFATIVSLAIQQTVKMAKEVDARKKTNAFLDRMNDEFFRPRGLYCLVMTWNPESYDIQMMLDLNTTISSSIHANTSGKGKLANKFRSSDGKTFGELAFPEAAPLVFPALDSLAGQEGEEAMRKRDKLKKKQAFVEDYWDRRAQAKFSGENPESNLAAGPKASFTSRYADPNHPAASGNLISLITGGYINPPSLRARGGMGGDRGDGGLGGGSGRGFGGGLRGGFGNRLSGRLDGGLGGGHGRGFGGGLGGRLGVRVGGEHQQGSEAYHEGRGGHAQDSMGHQQSPQGYQQDKQAHPEQDPGSYQHTQEGYSQGLGGIRRGAGAGSGSGTGILGLPTLGGPGVIHRLLKKDVLYLLIVNMPSEEELAAATAEMQQDR